MKKWAVGLAVAGALWMIVVLASRSLSLAKISNYPGVFTSTWVQYRGIAPSPMMVWAFNLWLILTSAIEWMWLVSVCVPWGLPLSVLKSQDQGDNIAVPPFPALQSFGLRRPLRLLDALLDLCHRDRWNRNISQASAAICDR